MPLSLPTRRKAETPAMLQIPKDSLPSARVTSPRLARIFDTFSFQSGQTPKLQIPRFFRQLKTEGRSNLSLSSAYTNSSDDLSKEKLDQIPFIGAYDPGLLKSLLSRDNVPAYAFCEEYDGFNKKKTTTISESIMALKAEKNAHTLMAEDSPEETFERSTNYFDRLEELREKLVQASSDSEKDAVPSCTPISPTLKAVNIIDDSIQEAADSRRSSLPHMKQNVSKVASIRTEFSGDNSDNTENNLVGSVDLTIRYDSTRRSLNVTIIKAEDVSDPQNFNELLNPFIKLVIYQSGDKKKRTRTVNRSRHPFFNESFSMEDIAERNLSGMSLLLQLYHKKRVGSKHLGETLVWLEDLDLTDGNDAYITEMFRMYLY